MVTDLADPSSTGFGSDEAVTVSVSKIAARSHDVVSECAIFGEIKLFGTRATRFVIGFFADHRVFSLLIGTFILNSDACRKKKADSRDDLS
jgi:hypothetical protein